MKLAPLNPAVLAPPRPAPIVPDEVRINHENPGPLPPLDHFRPGLPDGAADALFKFGLTRQGSEELEAAAAKQRARAQAAVAQTPPDLKTYFDARKKLDAIEAEQGSRILEQRSYALGLQFKDDAGLKKEFSKATSELERVMNDPTASEADRERARAHVQAVVAEMERRD